MQIKNWITQASQTINSHSPELDAQLLLAERLGKNRAYLRAFDDTCIEPSILDRLESDLQCLSKGYPLAYLLGKKPFWDMILMVTEDTLIPRADSETLLETLQTLYHCDQTFSIADLGTGTGALAIAISRIFPNANITATDISENALLIAKKNAKIWAKSIIDFRCNNWMENFTTNSFDCIVSNPPYIEEGDPHLTQLQFEPLCALTSPDQGLYDIKKIIQQSATILKPKGWLLLEHGYNQASQVHTLLQNQWLNIKTINDLGDNPRITLAQKPIA